METTTIVQVAAIAVSLVMTAQKRKKNLLLHLWDEFRELDMALVAQNMYSPILVDTRNLFKRHEMEKLGFVYHGMGT